MEDTNLQTKKQIGEQGYINKNCWLAKNLGYPPSKRCQYCELRFNKCLFEHYLVISLLLTALILILSYLIEGYISKSLIISIFILVISYGYFFNKSTEKIIVANFQEKKAKDAFSKLSQTLQQKVEEQTKEIRGQKERVEKAYELEKKAREDLQKLDGMKTEFMVITQHHLRTPLSVMQGYADLILNGTYGKLPKKIKDVVLRFRESSVGLIRIVNEFLDISQFQLGREIVFPQANVNMEIMIDNIIKQLKISADEKGIYLRFKKNIHKIPPIMADQNRLEVVLFNVIDNAIKYTKQGGVEIDLKIEKTGSRDSNLLIEVKDTGIGIKKEDLQKIFDNVLVQTEDAKKINVTGKGIGLYISDKIMRGHNGKIWAESEGEGKGASFYIKLPIL